MVAGYTFDDYVSLAMHRAAVWLLIEDSSQVGKVQETLQRWTEGGADPQTLADWDRWRAILAARDWTQAIAETQDGKHLRRSSPLPEVLPKATSLEVSALVHAWRDRR